MAAGTRIPRKRPSAPIAPKSASDGVDANADGHDLTLLAENRVAIEGVAPQVDGGRFPAKTVVGDEFVIEADIFSDGHDTISATVLYRPLGEDNWRQAPMRFLADDRWQAIVTFAENRFYEYTIAAWRNLFETWRIDTIKKRAAGLEIGLELEEGRRLIAAANAQAGKSGTDGISTTSPDDTTRLGEILRALELAFDSEDDRLSLLSLEGVTALMKRVGPRTNFSRYERILQVFVDRKRAGFSAWYELFPRSQSGDPSRHGTFDDVIKRLPYVRDLGFDVLYFPPIHPIGTTNRKGRDNSLTAGPDDPGSPYAIGSAEGGHDAIHPQLGTLADFDRLVAAAHAHDLEIALDFAIQCSPDHPWIKAHPEWFDWRPDGTIKFAENPPKKYEDIVNVHFYRDAIPGLWLALRDIMLFWVEHGVKIFRVDNPHTKPLPFWEWVIGDVRAKHPETIFLAEAFTRPKVMKRLAKIGFSQSYSYFTWRNSKWELETYLTELTTQNCQHYMRPNFFASTPDINPPFLQTSGRPGFQIRLVLAATLAGNYGIYSGFEISEAAALQGREEFAHSEKYEIRDRNFEQADNIAWDIRLINRLRRAHPALQGLGGLQFYATSNENIICYAKRTRDKADFLLFHVCLDPHGAQEADFEVPLWEFAQTDTGAVDVEDMVSGNHFSWHGKSQHIRLDPYYKPYAIWRIEKPAVPQ